MDIQTVFKRYEIKYFLTELQMEALKQEMHPYMEADTYGKSQIMNIYFDTPNDLLIRHSLEKPVYKEKLRLRSYSVPDQDSTVFLEIKKKYEGIVYKRRISAPYQKMMDYLEHDIPLITKKESMLANTATDELRTELPDDIPDAGTIQILHEIDYFRSYYQGLSPHVFLSYDREAFYDKKGNGFRITFDRNIRFRTNHLKLSAGNYGELLLPEDQIILEIKTSGGMPLWLTHFLGQEHLQKGSFSKYGSVYQHELAGIA